MFIYIKIKKVVSPKGSDAIKGRIKSIIETTKSPRSVISSAIKIPITSSDNGAVEYYETLSSVKEDIKVFKGRLSLIENLHLRILSSTTPEESKGLKSFPFLMVKVIVRDI